MPKIKTRKTIQKRIIGKTADGLLRLRHQSGQHRARFKSKRALQQAGHNQAASSTISKKISKIIAR